MEGMTLKQYARYRFFRLCDAKRSVNMATQEGREEFVRISVQLHIAKGSVPKRLWKYANR